MFQSVAELNLDDFYEIAPGVVTLIAMPLSFSIAVGLGLGLITYTALALATGRARSVPVVTYVLAAIFFLYLFKDLLSPA